MSVTWPSDPVVRRVLRSLALWSLGQLGLIVVGRLVARRLDHGDEASTDIRRVYVMGGEELRPTDPGLSQIRVDAVMGGAQLDLTAIPPAPGGIDVTVRALMGGVGVRVPAGWRTWWSYRGAMGGVAADTGVERVTDPSAADVRLHAHAVMGGVGIETPTLPSAQQKPGVPCQAMSAGGASSLSTEPSISP